MDSILQGALDLYKTIIEAENVGSPKAITLRSWITQHYQGQAFYLLRDLDDQRQQAGAPAQKKEQPNKPGGKQLQTYVHPIKRRNQAPLATTKEAAPPVEEEASESLVKKAAAQPQERKASPTQKATETAGAKPVAVEEAPAENIDFDFSNISGVTVGALQKQTNVEQLRAYLRLNNVKFKASASHRQLAALAIQKAEEIEGA